VLRLGLVIGFGVAKPRIPKDDSALRSRRKSYPYKEGDHESGYEDATRKLAGEGFKRQKTVAVANPNERRSPPKK
jgi:hypothetical protein